MNLSKNPELIPLVEWWEKDGKQFVLWLAIAAVAVGGWYGWKNHQSAKRIAASDALVNAYTTAELEESVEKFAGTATEGALKLRLAKSYFDASRYEEALGQYEAMIGNAPDGFSDIPVIGKAQCLEAMGKFAEARKAFEDFIGENPKSYLTLTAKLGVARTILQAGDQKESLKYIETLKTEYKDDELATARIEATESTIKRFKK